jgi:L-iditol 2-dehydrogenase
MAGKMKAALMLGPGKIEMGEVPIPEYGDDDVLIKVKHVGICGADLEFFKAGRIGGWVLEFPHILGHEPAGVVEAVGKNVKHLKAGDVVAIEPGKACFKCSTCLQGYYNMCPDMVFMSVPGCHGAFKEFLAWPANLAFKAWPGTDTADACLAEPLAVGIHSVAQSGIKFGQSAAILGAGCIGLCLAQVLKAQGITEIYMTDHNKVRLDKAKALGVNHVFNDHDVDVVAEITKLSGGGVDKVFECTGSQKSAAQSIGMMKTLGVMVVIGMYGEPTQPVDLNALLMKEGSIVTNFRYCHNYPAALAAMGSGTVKMKDIVSHRYKLEQLPEALNMNIQNKKEVTKIVIEI